MSVVDYESVDGIINLYLEFVAIDLENSYKEMYKEFLGPS